MLGQGFDSPRIHLNKTDMKHIELKILNLELQKKEIELNHYNKKLVKYLAANEKVYNAVSQDDIDDLELKVQSLSLEIEIIKSKIESVDAS